jgi:MFS family permease
MKKSKHTIKAAILFYSLVQAGTICISSILVRIAEVFPGHSTTTIQFLATCPSVVIIIMSLATGKLAEYIPKKYLALFSSAMFLVTAFGGFFFHGSLPLLFLWEIILGIGLGILVPLGTSLIADYFAGEERNSLMGLQSAVISVGGVLLSLIGGLLAAIDWNYNYLAFLMIIPGFLLLAAGLPLDRPAHSHAAGGGKIRVTPKVAGTYGLIAFLFMLFYNVVAFNLAMHLEENQITGSTNAGIASALFMLSGAIAGILFNKLVRFLGEKVIALGFFNLGAGALIMGVAGSFPLILIGIFIAGFSLSIVMAQVAISIADREKPEAVTMCIAICMGINNLGGFLSPNITKLSKLLLSSDKASGRYMLVGALALAAAAVMFFVLGSRKTNTQKD